MKWQQHLPVLISIGIIVMVAVLQRQNKIVAAITATMPLNIPLALWIVYASANGERQAVTEFSLGLLLGGIPTLLFLIAIWLAARAGLKLGPLLFVGYGVWGLALLALLGLRRWLGA
jgi:hypothetical protein